MNATQRRYRIERHPAVWFGVAAFFSATFYQQYHYPPLSALTVIISVLGIVALIAEGLTYLSMRQEHRAR